MFKHCNGLIICLNAFCLTIITMCIDNHQYLNNAMGVILYQIRKDHEQRNHTLRHR